MEPRSCQSIQARLEIFSSRASLANKYQISGRVVIDAFAYHTFFDQNWIGEHKGDFIKRRDDDSKAKTATREDSQEGSNFRRESRKPFTEEDHLLSVPTVKGFDLENRQWAEFYIDSFRDIVWNEFAYDKLVLDENEKKMIFAFSEQVRDANNRPDDFIKNKGEIKCHADEIIHTD